MQKSLGILQLFKFFQQTLDIDKKECGYDDRVQAIVSDLEEDLRRFIGDNLRSQLIKIKEVKSGS